MLFAPGAASALAMAVAHRADGFVWLSLVAFVPFLSALRLECFALLGAQFLVTMVLFEAMSLTWIHGIDDGYTWVLVYAVLYHAGFCVVPAVVLRLCRTGSSVALLVLPAAWALMELIGQSALLRIWSPLLGQPLVEWPLLSQTAALLGPHVTTYIVVSTNVAAALWLREGSPRIRVVGALHALGCLGLGAAWSLFWLAAPADHVVTIRAGVVQPNIPTETKWNVGQRRDVLGRLDHLINSTLASHPQIIILPETAVPGFIRFDQDLTDWVRSTVIRTKCPLLFGTLDRSDDASRFFNAAMMVATDGRVLIYHKLRLVPFGEYLPTWTPWKSFVRARLRHLGGDRPETFDAGRRHEVFPLEDHISFAPLICLEDSFPAELRDAANRGADAAVVLSDTAWTTDTIPIRQHLQRARLTAIATGMPMIRCTNGGISGVIDDKGRVLETMLGRDERHPRIGGAHVFDQPLPQRLTVYRQGGDAVPFLVFCSLILVGIAVSRWHQSRGALDEHEEAPPPQPLAAPENERPDGNQCH